MKIEAVIFDLDGTLLDSFGLRVEAWAHAFIKFGVMPEVSEIQPLIGLPGQTLAAKYSDDPYAVEMEEERFFEERMSQVSLYPDVESTFAKLSDMNIPAAIVTSSRRKLVSRMRLPTEKIVTIDDVSKGKPDPEPYRKAMQMLGVSKPMNVVVVGDAMTDIIPANDIGAISVLIKHGKDYETDSPNFIVDEVSEVLKVIKNLEKSGA
ncbi:MAG: HAD family phosphatase [Thermoplasmataceae archaeon]